MHLTVSSNLVVDPIWHEDIYMVIPPLDVDTKYVDQIEVNHKKTNPIVGLSIEHTLSQYGAHINLPFALMTHALIPGMSPILTMERPCSSVL